MPQPRLLLLARCAGALGGLAWLARWPLGDSSTDGAAADATYWLGLVALAVSLAAYGAALVKVAWLQVVVALALPVLVWSVLEVLRGDGDGLVVDAVVGLVLLVVAVTGLVRARSRSQARAGRRTGTGAHTR
ncbi:hypothetical protein [Nocardioides deserti]|uniref:Uncharacterized protein n=1 Tax=Nocardioides deserti TaxID=1588644 RepID=A0ABR6UDU4_9ACTN|nr:hypothetical protein [Nocardioides deserti]MBC2962518.1 hypothetical protein [Nocardioides deserti]GGO78975.1 hypothetical protein GCM10012276_37650 [Nocardioides deserti]